MKWVTELVASLHSSPQVYTTRQFLTLVQALYIVGHDQEEEVASAVHLCLTNLFQNPRTYPAYIIKGSVTGFVVLCLLSIMIYEVVCI